MLLAHKNQKNGEVQSLEEHLLHTASLCAELGREVELEHFAFLLGLLHDFGKRSKAFQHKIQENTNEKVVHSNEGATMFFFSCQDLDIMKFAEKDICQAFVEIGCYVITAHHGLYDIPKQDKEQHWSSAVLLRSSRDKEHPSEEAMRLLQDIYAKSDYGKTESWDVCLTHALREFIEKYKILTELAKKFSTEDEETALSFYLGLFVRLLLSILKRADVFDTINAFGPIVHKTEADPALFEKYSRRVEERYAQFPKPESPINKARAFIASEAKRHGNIFPSGIYKFNVPTGAGKTLASLSYAVEQLQHCGKKKMLYATAFLSVLEQNAAEIRSVLGEEGVLEHHSNIVDEQPHHDETEAESVENMQAEYLLNTWDAPVVLTTMVQFFTTLLKQKASNIMRFSNLSNSVIILDEVQSLPLEVTYLFNLTLNFLAHVMHCNLVLCTATQPLYNAKAIAHRMAYHSQEGEDEIVVLSEAQRLSFKRVHISKLNEEQRFQTLDDLYDFLQECADKSRLVIVNTKKAALMIYKAVKDISPENTFYLSTDLCAAHRHDVFQTMHQKLKEKEPILCVSTQLIEAGVDLDFAVVVRSLAGIDSIVQAAGRCNREGKRDSGEMKLIDLPRGLENLNSLESIERKKSITRQLLFKQKGELDILQFNDTFFKKYFSEAPIEMTYPLEKENSSLLQWLSKGKNYGLNTCLRQSFLAAGSKFALIKDEAKHAIVYYRDSEPMIEELIELAAKYEENYDAESLSQLRYLLKKLQLYTVPVYKNELQKEAYLSLLHGRIWILAKQYYKPLYGKAQDSDAPVLLL